MKSSIIAISLTVLIAVLVLSPGRAQEAPMSLGRDLTKAPNDFGLGAHGLYDIRIGERANSPMLPGVGKPSFYWERNGGKHVGQTLGLAFQARKVKSGDTVWKMLEENGFSPNSDLLALVQAINPKRENLDTISPGEIVGLPLINSDLPKNERVILVDYSRREPLNDTINVLHQQQQLMPTKYRSDLASIESSLKTLNEAKADLPGDFVERTHRQAEILRQLQLAMNPEIDAVSIGPAPDLESFQGLSTKRLEEAYESGLRSVVTAYDLVAKGAPKHRAVIVRTTSQLSGVPLCRLRIVFTSGMDYLLYGDRAPKTPLLGLSTPATGTAPVSDLYFWAEWQNKVVSDQVFIPISVSEISLDLIAEEGGACI